MTHTHTHTHTVCTYATVCIIVLHEQAGVLLGEAGECEMAGASKAADYIKSRITAGRK